MLTVVFAGAFLAGCALFGRDYRFYYERPVARVAGVEITRRQLSDAFSNFGHQFLQQGMNMEQAHDETLNMLINRIIIADASRDMFGDLTSDEIAQRNRVSYDVIERRFRTLETQIREERDWQGTPLFPQPEAGDEPNGQVHNPHTPQVVRRIGGNGFVLNTERFINDRPAQGSTHQQERIGDRYYDIAFIDSLLRPRGFTSSVERSIANETLNRFVRQLQQAERGFGYRYNTEAEKRAAIQRELWRIQIEEEKNILVRRMQDAFNFGITRAPDPDVLRGTCNLGRPIKVDENGDPVFQSFIDDDGNTQYLLDESGNRMKISLQRTLHELNDLRFNGNPNEFSWEVQRNTQFVVDDLVRRANNDFRNRLVTARFRYDAGYDRNIDFGQRLLQGLGGTYFVPRNVADQFFTVSHILVGFNDAQQAELEAINARYAQDTNTNNRDNAILALRNQVTVTENINGRPGNEFTAAQVLEIVRQNTTGHAMTLDQRQSNFHDLIYRFNADPGMFNAQFEYVIGIDTRQRHPNGELVNIHEEDTMSRMVPEFTAESRRLHATGQRGAVSHELIWTDHGAHIVMYTRNISDFIFTSTARPHDLGNYIDQHLQHFLHSTKTSYGNLTFFDATIDRLSRPAFTQFESQILRDFKGQNEIIIYQSRVRDLTRGR